MKSIKLIISIFFILVLFFCENDGNMNSSNTIKHISNEEKLLKMVKNRTRRDLRRIGIEKMLLIGEWQAIAGRTFVFKKNGKAYVFDYTNKIGFFYWKVQKGKLYIKPNNIINRLRRDVNKFYKINVKAIEPGALSRGELKVLKYSLSLRSNDDNVWLLIKF